MCVFPLLQQRTPSPGTGLLAFRKGILAGTGKMNNLINSYSFYYDKESVFPPDFSYFNCTEDGEHLNKFKILFITVVYL